MTVITEKSEREGYIFDAAIKGADTTFWQDVEGTLAADTVGANKTVRVNSARIATYLNHIYGDYEFALNVPTVPTAGDSRVWGLRSIKQGDRSAVYFEIDGATFRAVSIGSYDTTQEVTTLNFDTDWDATVTRYRIQWEPGLISFLVNDTVVARHTKRIPEDPLPIEIKNANADNLDLSFVKVRRAGVIQ